MRILVSLWAWLTTGLIAIAWLPLLAAVFALTAPFDPGRYAAGRFFRRAAVLASTLNPFWRFRTSGVKVADPRRPYVVVSNHESIADIFLISHLPWEMKWLSKEALFRMPVMGWLMRMAGDIRVRRDDARSRARAVDEIRDRLRKKVSVMVFPEGTRSGTGELLPFRDGAFRIAIEEGVPVLPLAVVGTINAIPKGARTFGRARAEVRVLEPVETAGLSTHDVPELRDRVRDAISRARETLRRELEDQGAEPRQVAPEG